MPAVLLSGSITITTLACDIENPFPPDLGVTCMDLAIDLIYELVCMANLVPSELVRFRA